MSGQVNKDELKREIERGNLQRAAMLAASFGLPEEEIKDLQRKALWQMAAQNRNAAGTKKLAQLYGLTERELREFLENRAQEIKSTGDHKILKARYDYAVGKHLHFEAWVDDLFKNWRRIAD